MLEKVNPWLELVRVFARLRRRRIRSFRFTRKSSDVRGRRFNPVSGEYELPTMNSSSGQETRYGLMETHSNGMRRFHEIRKLAILLGLLNWTLCLITTYVAMAAAREGCPRKVVIAAEIIAAGASLRLLWMLGMGFTQAVTASAMISGEEDANVDHENNETRQKRRKWYKWWLWWSRLGFLVTAVQVVGAAYFFFLIVTKASQRFAYSCSGSGADEVGFKLWLMAAPVLAWAIASAQCCVGSDVIAWRALYHDHDEAWRAHYREMFDYGIREVMCCLGRRRYLSQLDKDEVDSVAALLGDLVAYRAKGASHLEVVAGIALLREYRVQALPSDDIETAPETLLMEAAELHPYAVAAYTGFLLDLGRNPFTWFYVWLRRQGALTFWNRNRRPILEGDNWWRGHAAAFLRHAQLPPEALIQGRISQQNNTVLVREAVYFVAVLHQSKTVVVAVRGTETPEDLLTDGLGRECELSDSDLLGLLKGDNIPDEVKKKVHDTRPHYCHVGVIKAARELSMQLDNLAEDESDEQARSDFASVRDSEEVLLERKPGLLTRLLGPGGQCEGYKLRFVGHSLGGSIATLTALRLYKRYPELHVYAYGVLPCVDPITADACASFVTSVIYNDEYSSRLSVASVMRLRNRALLALESNSEGDSVSLSKLAWSFLGSSEQTNSSNVLPHHSDERRSESLTTEIHEDEGSERDNPAREHLQRQRSNQMRADEEEQSLMEEQPRHCERMGESLTSSAAEDEHRHPGGITDLNLLPNGMPKDGVKGSDAQERWPAEMYVPGLVIHLVKEEEPSEQSLLQTLFHFLGFSEEDKAQYSAVLKDRTSFRDIVISPNMFIDHAPWRCQHAMHEVIKKLKTPVTSTSGPLELTSDLV
ncbi:hypothetical protein M758_2G026800 [Ceratodon purpureus]|nr:hypothetical protein M758_2G026800 [Ceratodon purpureus]